MPIFSEKKYQISNDFVIVYSDTTKVDQQKPVLVFLHGLGGDLNAFNSFRELFFKHGYRSIAIDFRGHGLSTRVKNRSSYDFDNLADDVISILNQEQISSFILVGHCLGGLTAQKIAIKNPAGLKKLVLLNSTPLTYPLFKNIGFAKFTKYLALILERVLPTTKVSGRIDHQRYIKTGDFYVPRVFNDVLHTSVASYGQILSYVLNYDVLDQVHKITVPTLIIAGGNDKIFPTSWSQLLKQNIKNSVLKIYPKGNHLFAFASVAEVSEDIRNFLK